MSGGVDSSVSAALLKEAGHDVTGVFIRGWYPEWLPCDWRGEREDAMRVAAELEIPFMTCNLEDVYKRDVADYMISEYTAGRTPNPDVMCNKHVKFGAFFKWAMEQGADAIATGHYARLVQKEDDNAELRAGVDTEKDQSYFLWAVPHDVLQKTRFPVGEYQKSKVRELAEKYNLPTATKKDSQGICFLGKVDMRSFLKHYIDVEKGNVLNEIGEIIGEHEGALLYTLGQRHGFTVTTKSPDEGPHYVVAKDVSKNTITVSEHPHSMDEEGTTRVRLHDVNWTGGNAPKMGTSYMCRFRYRQPLRVCGIESIRDSSVDISFSDPQHAVARGQSLVIYDGDVCLGGGIIETTS